jgi:hypothetical protein
MRLQLTIQRHALPQTNILWTVPAQNPSSSSTHGSATISQLLEDVNDIVQLESDDWGLEDYVVEVGGYECLHFQPIDSVLKEDDKVTIRALQTGDLRIRRIGGRHQITADGRHLFDGVAFGRPYLRKASRPPFPIPPRKRRKLNIGHGQYIEDDSTVQELLAASDNVVHDGADVARRELDSHKSHDQLLEDLAGQLLHDIGYESAGEGDDDESDSDFRSFDEEDEDEADMELSEELKALLEDDPPEPGDYRASEKNPVADAQQDTSHLDCTRQHKKRKRDSEDGSEKASLDLNSGSNSPTIPVDLVPPDQLNVNAPSVNGPSSQVGALADLADQWMASHDDFSGFDENAPSSEIGSPKITSSEPNSETSSSNSSSISESVYSSTESESESGSESASTSESGSESDPDPDSSSDSTSKKDSEVIAVSTTKDQKQMGQAAKTQSTLSAISPVHNAPGQGSNSTKKNNQRQRKRKRLIALKAEGLLAPDAGFRELYAFELAESEAPVSHHLVPGNDLESTFEALKQRLLERLTPPKADSNAGLEPSEDVLEYAPEGESHALIKGSNPVSSQSQAALNEECQNAKPIKRAKLDLDSSRRMLFGSLGLKTPKTPADEQLLREKLAKQGRTPLNGRAKHIMTENDDVSGTHVSTVAENTTTSGDWKDKIILSAVECEVEGRLLTTPPFPFVQRWQQGNQKDQPEFQLDPKEPCNLERQQDTSTAADGLGISGPPLDGDPILEGAKLDGAIQSQLIREAEELSNRQKSNGLDFKDVPCITEINDLEALKVEDAVAGAVIAFKHLDMSKETNWQPEISAFRTAKIQEVLDDGTLKILLAERDRTPMQALFDEYTGERVFDKFEMPVDEEDIRPDNGIRDVSYSDLIEPKLVEGKRLTSSVGQSTQTARSSTRELKSDEEISQVKDSAKLTDPSVQEPSAQVEVSTPRQREISKLIKDAGFHSSLDSDLLQPTRESAGTGSHGDDSSRASPQKADKSDQASSNRSMNLDGAPSEADENDLNSPLFRGSDSNSMPQNHEFHDSSGNSEQRSQTSGEESQMGVSWRPQNSVVYPRISPLVIHESRASTMDGRMRIQKAHSTSSSKDGKLDDGSDMFDKDDDGMFEGEESRFDSLRSTIPPSDNAPLEDFAPSPAGSQITNPCLSELEGKTSSDDDLPSLSEITSTARSGRISPPKLKTSTSPRIESSLRERTSSAEDRTPTQTPTRFQSSQTPPGSQFVDLTLSSDPISPVHSDGEYGSTQRSSVHIKQSSSQVKARERLPSGGKTGNRRLVRGRFGRYTT